MADNQSQLQSLQRELEALKNLNDMLVVYFCDRVTQVASQFRGYIEVMAQTGVQVQECEKFRDQCYSIDEKNLDTLRRMIIERDLPMIRKYIDQVLRQFASIGYNVGQPHLKTPAQVSVKAPSNLTIRTGGSQDYEKQADAICDFMNFLVAQHNELFETLKQYQNCCNQMIQMGVPRQVYEHYGQNFFGNNVNQTKATAAHLPVDYEQLGGLFKEVLASMSSLGSSYSRSPRTM